MNLQTTNLPEDLRDLFSSVSLEGIIKSYLDKVQNRSYGKCTAFLNGETVPLKEDAVQAILDKERIKGLGQSIRITNLQKFYPPVKDICDIYFKKYKKLLTAAVYITPDKDSQCFLYHSDPQHIFVYQVEGEKRWSFPLIDGEILKETALEQEINKRVNENRIEFDVETLNLVPGDFLEVPYAFSHRAQNELNRPSVHLTFAEDVVYFSEFTYFLGKELLGLEEPEGEFFTALDQLMMKDFSPIESPAEKVQNFFMTTKLLKFKFGSRA